ncbi:oxygen-insensitive NADPH nitroreductase [Listeria ivanovii]|uniref:Putative Nitroflavin-reductase n=1 Tax=Listeria ivanovii (strain ATCC BAA-678 / PAM 55) TaxID=881621 RepID=G2ZDU0_LISIP|nr:oxygen-insensitive NADPH nitroreductase [Listeria ivanovii]AHI55435.1 FMN reductase [Listeria ivanovii WSLC3009]AIS64892.1 NADPH-flavin oxidoreductase [Listeria ivanovii subsp. ivanovii]MBC1758394.1 oxygen-insensitive NADPH nitroreductase [Listeria ivanovii]MBK3913270.1 oxygen-insensitive NADPH nitroreductase [Listeria ivanovii subsp. ivanovii]MBK3920613.1 oxygen-insensitive NADPH nitroreductase [Listeria ivanovii subsp. ivanovii]
MNQAIDTILGHYSVRKFEDTALTKEELAILIKSAQAASTSSFVQGYSIIGIADKQIREKISAIAGNQPYTVQTGQLFIFVADLARHYAILESEELDTEALSTSEKWLVAVIDAALAAQNMAIAAESLGLGICYIGGIRNNVGKIAEILELPPYTMPLFGLTVGHPVTNQEATKPRLPQELIYHQNTYQKMNPAILADYDEKIKQYYDDRTAGKRVESWSEQIASGLSRKSRLDLKAFLEKQHLSQK